jgi:membrane protein YqaA with SNARE-associated domain
MVREILDWLQLASQQGVQLDQFGSPAYVLLAAFGLGLLFGAVPAGGSELLALAAGAVTPRAMVAPLVVALTVGHVLGKMLWYWIGTLGSRITHLTAQRWIAQAHVFNAKHPRLEVWVLLMSAVTSVPPFHLLAVASGVVRVPVGVFVGTAVAGRLVRFGLVAGVPGVVGSFV